MQISFLAAADGTPLTKRFSMENGAISKTSYPMVKSFTSHTYAINTLDEFYQKTQEHATQGHCLLKGQLNQELSSESRAGSTSNIDSSQWVLFDLDNLTGFTDIEDFISSVLSPEFQDASYIVHWSSSAGLKPGFISCHLAFFLDRPHPAQILKNYLEHLNYTVPSLKDQLELNACGTSLKYKLDITTCQNDKLIFIAHPIFEGLEDPVAERIQLVRKGREFVSLELPNLNPAVVRQTKDDLVNELRVASGLKKKKIQYKMDGDIEYVANPDSAAITGVRHARGFVYLNLNGGDSWAYYFQEDNPEYVRSFKEPGIAYRLRDIDSEYYRRFKATLKTENAPNQETPKSGARVPLVFREIKHDQYWNGYYHTDSNTTELYKANGKDRLSDFCANNKIDMPGVVPDWTIHFDPTTTDAINFDEKWINNFVLHHTLAEANRDVVNIPPLIDRIIRHALNYDQAAYNKFINWLACMVQYREKLHTAWVLTGTEGTGKGLICEHIIPGLLGPQHCQQKGLSNLEDTFNAWAETCVFLNFNEARLADSRNVERVLNTLKRYITDPTITIRGMRRDQYDAPSFICVVITSNHNDAIVVTLEDRRFHIAPRQETRLEITQQEVEEILPSELKDFAGFLLNYEADLEDARLVELNEAKLDMIEASRTAHDRFFDALNNGDLTFFTDFLSVRPDPAIAFEYNEYARIIREWLTHANNGVSKVYRDDLIYVYQYLQQGKNRVSPSKFSRMCTLNYEKLINVRHVDDPTKVVRGTTIEWTCDQEIVDSWLTGTPQLSAVSNTQ